MPSHYHSVCRFPRVVCLLLLVGLLNGGWLASPVSADAIDTAARQLDERISTLIRELGHDHFAVRQRAEVELSRLGLIAFDALFDAQEDDEVEVALRAVYLVRSMRVSWIRENDPPDVKAVLRGYEKAKDKERQSRMERLSTLGDWQGVEALCRMVRFEKNEVMSKKAALLVMSQEASAAEKARQDLARRIKHSVGLSRRTAGGWLRTYVQTLADPETSLPEWKKLTAAEREVFSLQPEKSSPEIMGSLLFWQANMLRRVGREDEAVAILFQRLELLEDDQEEVLETVDWLIHRKAWKMLDELAAHYTPRFEDNAKYLYRLAEAQKEQGFDAKANELADRAFKIAPEEIDEHRLVGLVLQTQGLIDWAEREFRYVIKKGQPGSAAQVATYFLLSEMLHDFEDDLDAAAVLQELIDLMAKDQNARQQALMRRESKAIGSRVHYFSAEHFRAKKEFAKQRTFLEMAITKDPDDADVLIAMHRFAEADDEWKKRTVKLIEESAGRMRRQIQDIQRRLNQTLEENYRQIYRWQLASQNNQFAWLVGSTEGDYEEAIRCSRRSLELRPGTAGYLDTLGRCYYTNGDFKNAVKYQSRAVKLEPHSGQIVRQLKLFEDALAKAEKKKQDAQSETPQSP